MDAKKLWPIGLMVLAAAGVALAGWTRHVTRPRPLPGVPVRDMIFEVIPVTFKINVAAMIIALIVAVPVGILAAVRRNSAFDYGATVFSTLGVALPNFWIGLMLIVLFSLVLKWLPPFGLRSCQEMV